MTNWASIGNIWLSHFPAALRIVFFPLRSEVSVLLDQSPTCGITTDLVCLRHFSNACPWVSIAIRNILRSPGTHVSPQFLQLVSDEPDSCHGTRCWSWWKMRQKSLRSNLLGHLLTMLTLVSKTSATSLWSASHKISAEVCRCEYPKVLETSHSDNWGKGWKASDLIKSRLLLLIKIWTIRFFHLSEATKVFHVDGMNCVNKRRGWVYWMYCNNSHKTVDLHAKFQLWYSESIAINLDSLMFRAPLKIFHFFDAAQFSLRFIVCLINFV